MTNNQKKFCDEYLIDCNATRAYKVAYPRVKNDSVARTNGSRLLANANVKAYIDKELKKISSEKIADAAEVMEYLTSVMRGESSASVLSLCGVGCQEVIDKAPDEREKLKAAELLGKRYGLFKETLDVNGAVPVVIDGGDALED